MKAKEFYDLVVLMRDCQKNYFRLKKKKDKTTQELDECRKYFEKSVALENRVDYEIIRVQKIMETYNAKDNTSENSASHAE